MCILMMQVVRLRNG